jgi:hypothetical protein
MDVIQLDYATITDDTSDTGERRVARVMSQFDVTELQRLLAAYDPTVGTSPGVADARPVLRAILDAALAKGVPA